METTIPFDGFYESEHSANLDYALESIFSNDHGEVNSSLFLKANDLIEWQRVFLAYSQRYVSNFASLFGLTTLKFVELSSPREYNFTTDRIFCSIDLEEVKSIFEKVDENLLRERIAARFTSRSGFVSYYPNTLEEWPSDLSEWDINQVGTLLEAMVYADYDNGRMDFMEDSLELCFNLITNLGSISPSLERLFIINDYLRHRHDRAFKY